MMYKVFLSIVETFIAFGFGALAWRLRMIKSSLLPKGERLAGQPHWAVYHQNEAAGRFV